MKIWGDSRENMFDMYGHSREKFLEILAVVESDLLRLWPRVHVCIYTRTYTKYSTPSPARVGVLEA